MTYSTAAELLADPARWCQGALARDEYGAATAPRSDHACQWCLSGALMMVYRDVGQEREARERLRNVAGYGNFGLGSWNDDESRTHSEVLAAVQKAGV